MFRKGWDWGALTGVAGRLRKKVENKRGAQVTPRVGRHLE